MSRSELQIRSDYTAALAENDFGPLFDAYKVTYGKALEFIADTLYDTVTYVSGTTTTLAVLDGAAGHTLTDLSISNMPGQTLPDRVGFLILGYTYKPFLVPRSTARAASGSAQTGVTSDITLLTQNAQFILKLFDKSYATVPLDLIPGGSSVVGTIAAEGATADPGGIVDFATNGFPDARNVYTLEEPLFIPPLVQIQGQLQFATAVTLASGNTKLRFTMHGLKVRPVQ